jgi:D-lactate dehydrogenase (cytochrome)
MFKANDPKEVKQAKEFAQWMALKAIELGGTCTGEHGIGTGKKELLEVELGKDTIDVMRSIKSVFDKESILNPGKVFDLSDRK